MQANGHAVRNQTVPSPAHVREAVGGWAKSFLRREVIVDVAVAVIALESVGFVIFSLHKAFANYAITGI